MKTSIKKIGTKTRIHKWLLKVLKGFTAVVGLCAIVSIIVFAFFWAKSTNHFNLIKVQVAGYSYLDKTEIIEWLVLPRFAALTEIDLIAIQEKLEEHFYIKAARVSRDFPSSLCLNIIERSPVAYINHSPFLLVDTDGIILPMRDEDFKFDIPTLSGFNPASELYPIGEKCLSRKVLEVVTFLNVIHREFPHFYSDISEVTVNAMDEYVLCLSQYPTKVYLGSAVSTWQIRLLQQFRDTITGIRTLHDYKYVDLRYENQIIVKEKA